MPKAISGGVGMTNARGPEPKVTLGRACSTSLNCRMRTRLNFGESYSEVNVWIGAERTRTLRRVKQSIKRWYRQAILR